jgi:hypothetical protein
MTRTKKSFKSRKRYLKKATRRRGGQLTPLTDISTNSSIHDLDDYDEPSNNTTSESMMSNATTPPMANGPVATNLLGQFNAAGDDESVNLTNNTTAASDESSDNSFSDVATSFGNLGHGGKKRKEKRMRGGRKTRKHKKRAMRGGVRTWAQLPQEFEHRVYASLPEEEQSHFSDECFHKKNGSASIGDQKIRRTQEAQRSRIDVAARRMQEIAGDPNARIRQNEYNTLSQQEKQNWVASGTEGPQYDLTTIYRRRQQKDDLNWRARNTPNIHLDERDYVKLDAPTKALGWVRVVESDYRGSNVYYRRRVAADDELDQVKANIERMTREQNQIKASVTPVVTGQMLDEASIPRFSIRTDIDAYVTLPPAIYNRYQVVSNLLEEEEAKRSRLERQLEGI